MKNNTLEYIIYIPESNSTNSCNNSTGLLEVYVKFCTFCVTFKGSIVYTITLSGRVSRDSAHKNMRFALKACKTINSRTGEWVLIAHRKRRFVMGKLQNMLTLENQHPERTSWKAKQANRNTRGGVHC